MSFVCIPCCVGMCSPHPPPSSAGTMVGKYHGRPLPPPTWAADPSFPGEVLGRGSQPLLKCVHVSVSVAATLLLLLLLLLFPGLLYSLPHFGGGVGCERSLLQGS